MKRFLPRLGAIAAVAIVALLARPASAHAYTNGRLMDDQVFDNVSTMNQSQIQSFLVAHGSTCLANYSDIDFNWNGTTWVYGPGNISASQIIYKAAQQWGINPQVLIATLQKEESLVTGTNCDSWRYNSAMGYGCPDGGGCNPKYAGFSKQVLWGAWQLKFNRERSEGLTAWDDDGNITYGGFMTQGSFARCAGCSTNFYTGNATIDGQSIYLENGATASLYTYTPHLNQSFPGIFEGWFGSTLSDFCNTATSHPDASSQTNIIMVFALDASNGISCKLFNRGWLNWESLGSTFASAPGVVSLSPGVTDVFVKGNDNTLQHIRFTNGWGSWESLGGSLKSAPVAVPTASGVIDVFYRGQDDSLMHRRFDHGWQPAESLGGTLTDAPGAVVTSAGTIDVFVKGGNNELYHRRFANGWQPWEYLGGVIKSAPSAVTMQPGVIDVFARGSDDSLIHRRYNMGWQGWESLGGTLADAPAVSSAGPGAMDVFVRGGGNGLYHLRFANGWQGWESLGGVIESAPSVTFY